MLSLSRIEATRAAQAVLRAAEPKLVVDGWWGSFTNDVFTRASSDVQDAVRRVVATSGSSPEALFVATRKEKGLTQKLGANWISAEKADALAERAANEFKIDSSIMKKFLRLEAERKSVNGTTFFNASSTSRSGAFRGLYQMGAAAWTDVMPSIGADFTKVYDPWINTRAATAYVVKNFAALRKLGFKGQETAEVAYAAHNQGAGGFMQILKTGRKGPNFSNQSRAAQDVISVAAAANGVRLA